MNLLLLLVSFVASGAPPTNHEVRVREQDGDTLCSVRASDASVRALVQDLGAQLGRRVSGFEELRDLPRVTAQLEDRPPTQALRYILGAAGLRARITAGEIVVERELAPFPTTAELDEAAEAAFLAALVRFPDHAEGASARMVLGELEEQRGRLERAAQHFDHLAEAYPESERVPEALWRSGQALTRALAYSEARTRFSQLANLRRPHPFHAGARLELARCLAQLGDARQALFVLEALDRAYPAETEAARAERLMVRARAEVGSGAHLAALRSLERACALVPPLLVSLEAMELRARALELAGRPADAAVAWIAFSRDERTPNVRRALKEAARLALEAEGQELAVIFVHGLAEQHGFGDELLGELAQARGRLGLGAESLAEVTPLERLQRGELLLADGIFDAARTVLGGALPQALELDTWQRGRLAGALASARVACGDVEGGLDVLRRLVPTLESAEQRRGLYVLAGELLESVGLFEQAVDAYGGKL